jgi:hypothetical protein
MMARNGRLTKLTPFGGIPMLACVVPDLFGLTEATSNAGGAWFRSVAAENTNTTTRRERIEISFYCHDA